MRLFKKKDKHKICGYLDYKGEFYLNSYDRDKENKKIELESEEDLYKWSIDNIKRRTFSFSGNNVNETNRIIDELIDSGRMGSLVDIYFKHIENIKEINLKYAKS